MGDIVFAALGAPGHTFPLIPLAGALRDAGHRVAFAASAGVTDALAAAGLPRIPAGIGVSKAFGVALADSGLDVAPTDVPGMRDLFSEVFNDRLPRAMYADLLPVLERQRPDLVVAETWAPGAAFAARQLGIPCVLHSFGRRTAREDGIHPVVTDPLAVVAADLDVPLAAGDLLGHRYLDICPPSLQGERVDDGPPELPLRAVPWSPPVEFVARRTGRPWVYLTLGTVFGNAEVFRAAAEGLARLDIDVLIATGPVDPDALAGLVELGPGVQVVPFVPQHALLGQFDLVVHHGGSGTTLGACAAGVPQLFLPQGADQPTNADAVTALGIGAALYAEDITADAVEAHARALLTEPNRPGLDALAAEIAAMPSPAELAAALPEWATA